MNWIFVENQSRMLNLDSLVTVKPDTPSSCIATDVNGDRIIIFDTYQHLVDHIKPK